MMKRIALAALAVMTLVSSHGRSEDKSIKQLMQRKLQAAQRALEGVAVGNYDQVAKNGEELILISKSAEWRVIDRPQYELFSNEFRRRVESLIQAAKERNTDGAALAYVEVTLSCVKCHKYIREERQSRLFDR
jgi:hypothetical protein